MELASRPARALPILCGMKNARDMIATIAAETGLPGNQVQAAVDLLESGNTIPFIARYRKEATQSLDEVSLRKIEDAVERYRAIQTRKSTILKTIDEQGALTEPLRRQIEDCGDLTTLEAIYLPFKPKRRTRATTARASGLQPLADILHSQRHIEKSKRDLLSEFVDPDKGVRDAAEALQGALDIVAEEWSEQIETRRWLTTQAFKFGKLHSQIKRGKKSVDGADKFEQYFEKTEAVSRIPGHRVLAMLRGQALGFLRVGLELDGDRELNTLKQKLVTNRQFEFASELLGCVEDCYERLLLPAAESAVLNDLKEKADDEAIAVFGNNLQDLLMAAPAGPKVTIGIDPGFRTGCKVAVVDGTGQFLTSMTIYPTPPKNDTQSAGEKLLKLIQQHDVSLIAIGNGTASRETDAFVSQLIKQHSLPVVKMIVSESGASIYSASDLAIEEFPDLDITVRGAISIARRLQDPLAELVKCDPKSIGVGQYQHDVNQPKLRKCLDRVVESCVSNVGVELNMASVQLLSYVAGIGPKLAESIVRYRNGNGRFTDRHQLRSVPKLGKKAFEQAAGFLRIRDGDQPLDNSAVHPESYSVVASMAKTLKTDLATIVGNSALIQQLKPDEFASDKFGLPTIRDIIAELAKPGRDPRSEFRTVQFDDSVNEIGDLRPNMILEGVITNVTHFGAFVDLGVHQDALIHISQLSHEFVSDPHDVVSAGDIVKVKVLDVDADRKRIAVTRKF